VRGGRLARSKESSLGTWEGGRPLLIWGGHRTRNLLRGGLLGDFPFVLAARAGDRGLLGVGARVVVVWVQMAGGESGQIISASSELTDFVGVGVHLGVRFGVSESLAKLGVVERYEVFRVLSRSGGWCGWC